MNIRDLEYFSCLYEEKSFTKAAKKLYISQPSVTLAINRLEKELGAKLVIRNHSNREIKFTESGVVLKNRIDNILYEIDEVKTEIKKIERKKIKLGMSATIGAYFFPKFIPKLIEKNLIEHIEFIQAGSLKMKELLIQGKVDIALLGAIEEIKDTNLNNFMLKKEKFVMCISKNNELLKQKELKFSELVKEKFIVLGEGYVHTSVFDELLEQDKIKPEEIIYTNEVQTAKSWIGANLGVGIMVEMVVKEMKEIERIPLKNQIDFIISIATKKNHYLIDVEKEIIETIKETNKKI